MKENNMEKPELVEVNRDDNNPSEVDVVMKTMLERIRKVALSSDGTGASLLNNSRKRAPKKSDKRIMANPADIIRKAFS